MNMTTNDDQLVCHLDMEQAIKRFINTINRGDYEPTLEDMGVAVNSLIFTLANDDPYKVGEIYSRAIRRALPVAELIGEEKA